MPAADDPVHKGTLVCVVLKAKNLPNKRSIGKQDPYVVLGMGAEQQKTKPDKRGGQHPTWDEQLHFEVYEDMEDALAKKSSSKGGKKVLKVTAYADDAKEPELIGEGIVDLTDTLKTGEFDEWVTIKAKDRYAGEVYLELTFYSSAAPPKKKKQPIKPIVSGNDTYGGAGSFQGLDDFDEPPAAPPKSSQDHPPIPSSMRPGGSSNGHRHQMSGSLSTNNLAGSHRPTSAMSHSATTNDIPSSLRPSSSLAQIDAYTPPYAPPTVRVPSPAPPQQPTDALSEFGQHGRRHSFVAPEPSVTPSISSYAQSTAPASAHQPPPPSDRFGTMSSSYSHMSFTSSQSHAPDPTEQMTHSLSAMSFSRPGRYERPLPPPTAASSTPPPQSHIYQHPSQIHSQYQQPAAPTPPPPPQQQHSYSGQPSYAHHHPTPPPHPSSAPPSQADFHQQQHHYHDGQPPRPVSPAARPSSSLSQYATSAPAPTPSVINAQAFYQGAGSSLQPVHHGPPRVPSPGLPAAYAPIPSPYATQEAPPATTPGRAPRPLPPTQPMTQPPPAPYQQPPAPTFPQAYPAQSPAPSWQQAPPPPPGQAPYPPYQTWAQPPPPQTGYGAPPQQPYYAPYPPYQPYPPQGQGMPQSTSYSSHIYGPPQ